MVDYISRNARSGIDKKIAENSCQNVRNGLENSENMPFED
jgi:hypothetical protein